MSIQDQSHINHIRELLWNTQTGGASVMVGAGFSRNAIANSSATKEFPLWSQVAKTLCNKLYPESEKDRLKQALSEASGTSGFLRLAQEYEIAFGRGSLHNFIQNAIPDLEHQPSNLHHQLLELPWKEVLTTNWDTLLERTQLELPERSYSIVRTIDELANTRSPRIIKLHGTVPSHIPFIFTEEDYRTYPKKFAPFVNTVQQIMMETAVLLIGFSGDDPNFLQWSGWVKDNLGASSPKIYLAGWLNLSPHRRRMLENNNVVPIDISTHPKAQEWPEHLRHQYATEWIIKTLQCGQAYDYKNWPSLTNYITPDIEKYLEPIEPNSQSLPKTCSRFGMTDPIPTETLLNVLSVWEHNRKIYPNWIVFPIDKHYHLDRYLGEWPDVFLKNFEQLSTLEQLKFFKEVTWLYQKKLIPLPPEIKDQWDKLKIQLNFKNRTINSVNYSSEWPWIKEYFIEISLYTLINYRLSLDESNFFHHIESLREFSSYSIDIKNALIYEECQWYLLIWDFEKLETTLRNWNVSDSDSIWTLRKAALLLEINLEDQAKSLITTAYSILKKNPDKANDFANSSREGWALLSIQALLEKNNSLYDEKIKKFNISERFKQLEFLNCNTKNQINFLIDNLQKRKDIDSNISNPCFDLYRKRGETIHFNNYKYEAMSSAYQCLILCEVAALPLSVNNYSVGSTLIGKLIENHDLIDSKISRRIVTRLKPTDDDKIINQIYSRVNIANIETDEYNKLLADIQKLLNFCLYKNDLFWISYTRTSLEILSRLIVRLTDKSLLNFHLEKAISLFKDINLRKTHWLQKPLSNYLKRCWEACSIEERKPYILKILQLPINGLESDRDDFLIRIDEFLDEDEISENCSRTTFNETIWNSIISSIISGLRLSGKPRHDATIRLTLISKFINKKEYKMINELLWNAETEDNDFPKDTGVYDFLYITNKFGDKTISTKIFLDKYLNTSNNFQHLARSFIEISNVIDLIKLSEIQTEILFTNIQNFFNSIPLEKIEKNSFSRAFSMIPNDIIRSFSKLELIARNIDIPKELALFLFQKMNELIKYEIYSYRLVGILAKSMPKNVAEINTYLRKGIISNISDNSKNAMFGLFLWVKQATKENLTDFPYPSDDLIREVGLTIAMRRENNLIQALLVSNRIFNSKNNHLKKVIGPLLIEGLEYLILENNYQSENKNSEDTPIIRLNCSKLAYRMSLNGYADEPIIKKWLDECKNDPLPEVRNIMIDLDNEE